MMLRKIIIIFAMLGYVAGYKSLYAFHLVGLFWVSYAALRALSGASIPVACPRLLAPLLIFVCYAAATVIWVPQASVWARYMFYLGCGCIAILAIYQSVNNPEQLNAIFRVIAIMWLLDMAVGLLESFGIFRLPMSPYSPYVGYFGHVGMDWSTISERAAAILRRQPTGFNWNRNNFGFVLILGLPFVMWIRNRLIAAIGIILSLWLLTSIGSRGSFVAVVFMVLFIPLYYHVGAKQVAMMATAVVMLIALVVLPSLLPLDSPGLARMVTAFEQINRGLSLISDSHIAASDSTSERASIYLFGLQHLVHSYGLGLGFGGIESLLIAAKFEITNFHFFFLQLLIDFGIMPFAITMYFYLKLCLVLRNIGQRSADRRLKYLAQSTSLSLLVAIPASISPSGLHYVLPFYALIGLGLAIVKTTIMNLDSQ